MVPLDCIRKLTKTMYLPSRFDLTSGLVAKLMESVVDTLANLHLTGVLTVEIVAFLYLLQNKISADSLHCKVLHQLTCIISSN